MTRRTDYIVPVLFITFASTAWAQSAAVPAPSLAIEAVRAAKPPVIDGGIGEDEWRAAPPGAGFIQYEPPRGGRTPGQTQALGLYHAGPPYVAFCWWGAGPNSAAPTQTAPGLLPDR